MSNLALETALRGRILPDPTNYTPFIVTMDRRSPDVDFKSLKDNKVMGAVFEAGYLFDSIHMKQSIYKNPKLDSQVKAALDANLVYGLYADVRARSRSEEHTSELQSRFDLVCRLLLEKKKKRKTEVIAEKIT